jgi:hypothetical protein
MKMLKLTCAALLLGTAACGTSAETERKLAELEQRNAQKDSLMQEVALSARLISDVSVELARVQVRGRKLQVSSESPITAASDTMMAKLRYVIARVDETERQLGQSRQRIKKLTSLSDSLRATLDSTVTNLQTVIATQRQTIEQLTTENVALRDSMATVYYVVGTRDALKKKGILVEQGGSRVLFVLWRTGRTLQPARNLDPGLFTAIDSRRVSEIPLPDSTAEYRVASLQDLSYIAQQREHNKYVRTGYLTITSPADFWRNSKFLIVILEGSGTTVADQPQSAGETVSR